MSSAPEGGGGPRRKEGPSPRLPVRRRLGGTALGDLLVNLRHSQSEAKSARRCRHLVDPLGHRSAVDVRGRKAQGSGVLTGDRHGREGLRACRSTSDAASQKPSPAAATDIWSILTLQFLLYNTILYYTIKNKDYKKEYMM